MFFARTEGLVVVDVVVDGGVGWPRGRFGSGGTARQEGRYDSERRSARAIARENARGVLAGNLATLLRTRRGRGRDWNPAAVGGVAAGHGLAKAQSVGGAAAHRGGSDGRDVVGGGCTPLLARAPATNGHPWSIHGGYIRQVRPTKAVVVVLVVAPCHLSSSTCRTFIGINIGIDASATATSFRAFTRLF